MSLTEGITVPFELFKKCIFVNHPCGCIIEGIVTGKVVAIADGDNYPLHGVSLSSLHSGTR
jgi:hypothetical protein